ncbi:MAG TPA: MFS transporter [Candidatus Sulfotelmatobacter sp.]
MPVAPIEPDAKSSRALTAAAHAAFVPVGIATVLLGPLLPELSVRWSLNYMQAGSLFTAQYLTSTFGVAASGFLVSRWGFRFAMNAGLLAMAVGVGGLAWASHFWGVACIALYGVGMGLCVPAANLLVAEVNPARRSAALNLVNFSWSVGAVACPFLVAAASRRHRTALFLEGVSLLFFLVVVGISAMPSSIVEPLHKTGAENGAGWAIRRNQRSLLLLAALFFLYVGTENAFGGWTASYAESLPDISANWSVMTPSFFYFALLLGRWAAPFVLRFTNDVALARGGLLLASAGMAGLILSHRLPGVAGAAALAGLGLAAVYPITISLLSREFGAAATRVGSIMFTMANLGGASLPWLVGFLSNRFADLRAGLAVPLAAGALMFGLYWARWKPAAIPNS